MRFLILFLFFSLTAQARVSGFQNEDFKSVAELIAAGSDASHLLNINKVWDEVNGQLLSATISASGGAVGPVVSVATSNTTLAVGSPPNQQYIACDSTSGNIVVTVPLCAGHIGQWFEVKKIDSSANTCTLGASGSDVFDGNSSLIESYQYQAFTIVCRAAGFWDIL